MLQGRDFLIFFLLLFGVILVRIIPMPSPLRIILFIAVVVMQVLFVYNGLKRSQ